MDLVNTQPTTDLCKSGRLFGFTIGSEIFRLVTESVSFRSENGSGPELTPKVGSRKVNERTRLSTKPTTDQCESGLDFTFMSEFLGSLPKKFLLYRVHA